MYQQQTCIKTNTTGSFPGSRKIIPDENGISGKTNDNRKDRYLSKKCKTIIVKSFGI